MSLFDGMACGMIALKLLGVTVDRYIAYEIDKYAVQTSSHNFPEIEHRGDVFEADFTEFEGFDLLCGGSPCTYWSIAQSSDKRETTARGIGWDLFSQYVRALKEAKPNYFIYENNKSMARPIYQSISEAFGFEPIMINSALVSAQNRQRYYWVGKRNENGTYDKVDIQQPEDRGILLKDILIGTTDRDKGRAVIGSAGRTTEREYFKKFQGNMSIEPVNTTGVVEPLCMRYERSEEAQSCRKDYESHKIHHGYHELSELHPRQDGKTNTISTVLKDNPICEPVSSVQVGALPRPNGELSASQAFRVYSDEGKSVTLKGCGGGAGGKTGLYAIPIHNELSEKEMDYMVRDHADRRWNYCVKPKEKDKSPTITANIHKGVPYNVLAVPVEFEDGEPTKAVSCADGKTYTVYKVKEGQITIKEKTYPIKLIDGYYIIRKLTVLECMRLQTIPEWYKFPVSNTQAYKMLGNGWTINVISHILNSLK